MVRQYAYELWQAEEVARRMNDWDRARIECTGGPIASIFYRDSAAVPIRLRAEQLYQGRKDADALTDWLDAERYIATMYYVTDNT